MRTSVGIVCFALVTAMPLKAHAEITTRLVPSLGIAIGVTTDLTFGVFGGGDFEVELSDY